MTAALRPALLPASLERSFRRRPTQRPLDERILAALDRRWRTVKQLYPLIEDPG